MLATVVLLAACGDETPEGTAPDTEQTAQESGQDTGDDADAGQGADEGPDDGSTPVDDSPDDSAGGADEGADEGADQDAGDGDEGQDGAEDSPFDVTTGSIDLDEVVSFDSGVQVAVTGLTVEPMAILVDVEVLNGWEDDYTLSGFNEPRLTDNTDRRYPYVLPEENQDLTVPAGGTLQATLAFRGALNPNATRVELLMNRGSSQDRRQEAQFRDLPLPEGQ